MLGGQIKWPTNPNFIDIQAPWRVLAKNEV